MIHNGFLSQLIHFVVTFLLLDLFAFWLLLFSRHLLPFKAHRLVWSLADVSLTAHYVLWMYKKVNLHSSLPHSFRLSIHITTRIWQICDSKNRMKKTSETERVHIKSIVLEFMLAICLSKNRSTMHESHIRTSSSSKQIGLPRKGNFFFFSSRT